jgi:hypothetical protein
MAPKHETTGDEMDKLRTDAGTIDARMIASGNSGGYQDAKVGRELCNEWRERAADGETAREIAREHGDIQHTGVLYHLDDECKHSGVADAE